MAYDRDAAVSHADTHWNIPCDDGKFGLTNDRPAVATKRKELHAPAADRWQPMFVDDGMHADGTHAEKFVFRRTVGAVTEDKISSEAGEPKAASQDKNRPTMRRAGRQPEQIKTRTGFHWWPKPINPH
jgi:hypothetical protein